MTKRGLTWSLAAAFIGCVAVAGAQAPAADLEQRVDRYLEPYRDIGHLSGTILIARGAEPVYEKSFGLAHQEHGVPNTPRTRFGIGSVNKPMTIVVLARLLEAERLELGDPLSKFLPEFPRGDEITIDDLLNHSAGIAHRVTEPLDETRPQTPASMVELAAKKPLVFEPGTDSAYSSAGFSVLARVLELAGGKSYSELLDEYVLEPAGMVDTSDAGTRAILEGRAASYYFDIDGLLNAPPGDISYLVGAGSVYSTPRDLLAMLRALLAGELGERARQALVQESGDVSWNGLASGFRAFADYDAATDVTVALASNLTSGALDRIRAALSKIAAGEDVPTPSPINATPVEVEGKVLESYQGAYELRPGRNLELRVIDGRVRMNEWLLIPTSRTMLFSPQDYAEIEVVLDENGEVTRLDWTTGGETYPLPRVGGLAGAGSRAAAEGAEPPSAMTEYRGGHVFTSEGFVGTSLCTVAGTIVACEETAESVVDLAGGYVIPPFADAHTHHFDGSNTLEWHRSMFLEAGVFYAMTMTAPTSQVLQIRERLSGPKNVDVATSLGGITGPNSHPAEIYEALALGIRGYDEQVARAAEIRAGTKMADDAYFVVDTPAQVEAKWPAIMSSSPDLVKVFLRSSERYDEGFGKWGPGGGIDPDLLLRIRRLSREAGLRLAVANSSIDDFRASLAARADLVTHLPCYQDSMSDPESPYYSLDTDEQCRLSEADAEAAAAIGMGAILIASEWAKARPRVYVDWETRNVALLEAAGSPLAIGSNSYGATIIDGLIAGAAKGFFAPERLLRLATTDTARMIFPNRRVGCLEPGCEASFLVLDGDPLEDLTHIREIRTRVKDGYLLTLAEIESP